MVSAITQSGENHSYTYDNVGNITSVTRDGVKRTYVYDNLGQLTRVNDPADTKAGSTGTTWVYDYDRGGNILSKKYYAYTTGTLGSVKGTEAFTYGASNWGDKLATYKGTTVTYTGANIKKVDGWTYSYGYNNLLTKATKSTSGTAGYEKLTLSYDALGRLYERVHTVYNEDDGKNHVEFFSCFWNGDKLVHITRYTKVGSESYTKTDKIHFYYDADGKPSHVQLNDTRFFYQYNLQGDVIGILAGGHTQVVRYEYDAWGKVISITGSRKDNLGKYNPFRYRHYMYDDSVSLYYLKSRHYHPTLCRFLQVDKVLGKRGIIHSHNPYVYCKNNPLTFSDSHGYWPSLAIFTGIALAFTGGIRIYISNTDLLNSKEKEVAQRNLYNTAIAFLSKESVDNLTDKYWGSGATGVDTTRANAFKHALWNAIMTVEIGEKAANEFATAHEYNSFNNTDTYTPWGTNVTTTIAEATNMDMINNARGRYVGSQLPFYYNWDQVAQAVLTDMIENPNEYIWIERDAFSYPIK